MQTKYEMKQINEMKLTMVVILRLFISYNVSFFFLS